VAQLLAFAPESTAIDEPSSFARDRIAELPAAAGNNLFRVADTSWRLLWAIEKDSSPLNRAVAVHGLGEMLRKYRERPVEPGQPGLDHETAGESFRDNAAVKIGHLERTWPLPERTERPADARSEHASALRELSALRARSLRQQRARIRLLRAASAEEVDPVTRRAAADSLLAALDAACLHGLSYALGDPKEIVREAAIDELWQLGRGSILPWILDRLARVTASRYGPGLGVDLEPQVRRCLAVRCWGLSLDEAKARYEKGRSPLEFLHDLALEDPDPGLRLIGRNALANLLHRPIDPTGAWIPEWWQSFLTSGEAGR
jgi:hypothetical protein